MFNMRFNKTINRIGRLPYDLERNGAAMQIANYKMNYNVIVDAANSSIYVNANSYNTPIMDGTVIPCAKATLLFNNQIIDSKPLVYMGETIINSSGYNFVGSATFPLPPSGNISLSIQGGWNISFYPCGFCVPTYFGFPINSNTTIVIQ